MKRKTSAEERTIGMFSGLTQQEEDKIRLQQAEEDAKDTVKPAETIEESSKRWAVNAHFTQHVVSKHFDNRSEVPPGQAVYRLTSVDGWSFLESHRLGNNERAYGWTGLMLREEDIPELINVLIRHEKQKRGED